MEGFDELLARQASPYWEAPYPQLSGLGSEAATCARKSRLAAEAWESKSQKGIQSQAPIQYSQLYVHCTWTQVC